MAERYFEENESLYTLQNDCIEQSLETIVSRYIGSNPEHPMVYRAFNRRGIKRIGDYRYQFQLDDAFPEIKNGQYVYAWAKIWMDKPTRVSLAINCFGPAEVFVNQERIFRSSIVHETDPNHRVGFSAQLEKGWNHFVLLFMKTPSGIGGLFGTGSFKRHPLHFLAPSSERDGQEGWIFTQPLDAKLTILPSEFTSEKETGLAWQPKYEWTDEEKKVGQQHRIFGDIDNHRVIAWSKMYCKQPGTNTYEISGTSTGLSKIYINNQFVLEVENRFRIDLELPYGEHDVIIQGESANWGFVLEETTRFELKLPYPVQGAKDVWFYAGPFSQQRELDFEQILHMDRVIETAVGDDFWRLDAPHTYIRPYLENPLYGKWDYPLGVTLYGLLRTGEKLSRKDYIEYAQRHIQQPVSLYEYSLWDKEQYGAAGVNNQLSAIDSLDDCGSFGSTMLLADKMTGIRGSSKVADDIADYITNKQSRLADGTLYRIKGSVDFMIDTMWCDDLYMSIPFLCRYYQKTDDDSYLNDAIHQMLSYKKYMFMEEQSIMSHVYDFKFNTATGVPWGRGNGWVIFSLTELLETMPKDHPSYQELIEYFRVLAKGYLALQGENGVWHQVLTDPESYEESSCTSMFIYSYAKGVRHGWFDEPQTFIDSVFKGWEGLTKRAVDKHGNVYGVCQGSGYAFTGDYYKNDLSWILNDTHGIGIVLLAGVETLVLKRALSYM